MDRISRIHETGLPISNDDRLNIAGRERVYNTVLFPLFDSAKRVSSVGGIALDVTERVEGERLLRESEERLTLALKGADLGTWDWYPGTGQLVFNDRWAEMLGYQPGELPPLVQTKENLMHPGDAQRVKEILQKHLNGETEMYYAEHRLKHQSGTWVWILDKGRVIERDEQGHPVRVCGTHVDITTRKMAEDERERLQSRLINAQKMETVGTLAAGCGP